MKPVNWLLNKLGLGKKPPLQPGYRDLAAYKKALALAVATERLAQQLPRVIRYNVENHLCRMTRHICTEIAEGYNQQNDVEKDWRRPINHAVELCEQSAAEVDLCFSRDYITQDTAAFWQQELDSIINMLHNMTN